MYNKACVIAVIVCENTSFSGKFSVVPTLAAMTVYCFLRQETRNSGIAGVDLAL